MIGALAEPRNKRAVSPSRTYVAVCNNHDFSGYYFKKFTLPESVPERVGIAYAIPPGDIHNDAGFAAWWFLNVLNTFACIDGCIPYEDYTSITDEKEWWNERTACV